MEEDMMNQVKTITYLPSSLFQLGEVQSVKIAGRGGKEKEISSIFVNARRVSSRLFDYEIVDKEKIYRIEIKKQANDQWFDLPKYHNLTEEEKRILMLFVLHKENLIRTIAIIELGKLLEILLSDPEYKRCGWKPEVIKVAKDLSTECPELQFKAKLKVASFITKYRSECQIVYES
jgi:hypothetical protein